MRRYLLTFIFLACAQGSNAWNTLGHRLIGQIAYNNLTSVVREKIDFYNQQLDAVYRSQTFVNAAPWMDTLRYLNDVWMKTLHYIDIPFSWDNTPLTPPEEPNAVTAINAAQTVFKDKQTSAYNKGFSIRILLHLIGDLHQPLHASNQFSREHKNGDRGGNLFYLGHNPIATNLHGYWDRGAGFLLPEDASNEVVRDLAAKVEEKWPCDLNSVVKNANVWSEESFQVALEKAYLLKPYEVPSAQYQLLVQETVKQRIALAGCRLARVLNDLIKV